eukprot:s1036_g1.t1
MLAMSAKGAATYGSGSINATFASDILRLQDLWTGIMWSLLSPLSRVLITIVYAFTVSPQVGVLALSVFPIIFVTVPQGSSSQLAAMYSVKGRISVAEFTGFVSLLSSLGAPSISLGSFYRVAVSCAGSAQRIDEFLDQEALPLQKDTVVFSTNGMAAPLVHTGWDRQVSPMQYGDLTISNLSFRYPERTEFAISDVSISAPAGSFVALVGGSGCGKSTLLSLLMTWLTPSEGTIQLGEEVSFDARQGDANTAARRLRKSISVVFQDKTLLRGSVLDNILISAPSGSTRADAEWACQQAGCADFITSTLPDSYDTLLGGSDGVTLSGGQAQRLCIARALCRKPALLLLDEATSALDSATERHVLQTISSLRRNHPEDL